MATYKHIITDGPNKWALTLALFDNENRKRLLRFTAEYKTDVVGLEACSYEMRILVSSVKKLKDTVERWQIEGIDTKHRRFVMLRYSTTIRKGTCEFERPMPVVGVVNWTCDWCKKSFSEDEAHPHQASSDGGTICSECLEKGYGHDPDEDDNEDPLEGAVEPVGGSPSKDKPLYDQRTGELIGHVPIEYLDDFDDE